MFRKLGCQPTPITWGEAYLALQTGVVDGMETPLNTGVDMNFHEVTK
jgi:TRAP-type C4-dicarboxylate transport system substrate-binding protein